jgi:hypothetical protein
MKEFKLTEGPVAFQQPVSLKSEGIYTFIVQREGKNYKVSSFEGDPPVGRRGPIVRIHNLTAGSISIDKPTKASIPAGGSSESISLTLEAIKVSGKAGTKSIASNELSPVADGAYVAVVYDDHGTVKAKVFHSNPPMQVVGAPR